MTTEKTADTSSLNIHISSHAKADLTFLQAHLGGTTQKDTVQRALSGFRAYVEAREAGHQIIIRHADGSEEHVRLLGGNSIPSP